MNEEIKKKLVNAGFSKITEEWNFLVIKGQNHSISINKDLTMVRVYPFKSVRFIEAKFTNLEELNKICYPFNNFKDLNFEGKKYTWEECLDTEKGYFVGSCSEVNNYTEMTATYRNKNICPTEKNAISIGATTQLMQICKRINEDFDKTNEGFYYPLLASYGAIEVRYSTWKYNHLPMNSEEAAEALIKTNLPLLKQYFETEKPC